MFKEEGRRRSCKSGESVHGHCEAGATCWILSQPLRGSRVSGHDPCKLQRMEAPHRCKFEEEGRRRSCRSGVSVHGSLGWLQRDHRLLQRAAFCEGAGRPGTDRLPVMGLCLAYIRRCQRDCERQAACCGRNPHCSSDQCSIDRLPSVACHSALVAADNFAIKG